MIWSWKGKVRPVSQDLLRAQKELESADRRLMEARERRQVSETVKVNLQDVRAKDYFTPTIFPKRGPQ